ncbi:Exosortase EpsH-related protein [uncultured Paludibacter sp.]|nr:Exosortase EpsH-related protein [uncultured Paludibacter sp.]
MQFPEKLKSYKGTIFFVVALLAAHFFWKFTVIGDENGDQVQFFGLNISQPFIFMSAHIAKISDAILNFFGFKTTLYPGNIIRYENNNGVYVIWGCTGIKQTFIFTVIMIFARGSWKNKLWYMPLGWLCIYLFNVFRIVVITAFIKDHPEWFTFLHEHLFKYLFYVMIFFIWVYWEEKIAEKEEKQ